VAAVCLRQLSVPSIRGQLMSSSLRATGWRPSAADWGGGMSVMLHIVPQVPLAHANQLPVFQDCKALLLYESSHVSSAISSTQTFFTFCWMVMWRKIL